MTLHKAVLAAVVVLGAVPACASAGTTVCAGAACRQANAVDTATVDTVTSTASTPCYASGGGVSYTNGTRRVDACTVAGESYNPQTVTYAGVHTQYVNGSASDTSYNQADCYAWFNYATVEAQGSSRATIHSTPEGCQPYGY